MTKLNPRQFFHGTDAEIPIGGELLPSVKTGRSNFDYGPHQFADYEQRRSSVFAIASEPDRITGFSPVEAEREAWDWAPGGRKKVYRVEPGGPTREDHAAANAVMMPSAKVLDQIDIPPPLGKPPTAWNNRSANWQHDPAGQSVQGTLPPQNWGEYRDPLPGVRLDAGLRPIEEKPSPPKPAPKRKQVPGQKKLF